MKKLLSTLCITAAFAAIPLSASAYYVGEAVGSVTYAGLDTYINNYPINAYYMDGRQVVCAEDLRDYGFKVDYNNDDRALYIEPDYSVTEITRRNDIKNEYNLNGKKAYDIIYSDIKVFLCGNEIESYCIDGRTMIKLRSLETLGRCEYSAEQHYSKAFIDGLPETEYVPLEVSYDKKLTVVLDAGHGKSSWLMSDEEKYAEGYDYNNGGWGEWRHWKNGTADEDCWGSGCHGDRSCWYAIENGDRDGEGALNLRNALAAKNYLEELGYNVRLTRTTNDENPSFSKRVSYCYPNNDLSAEPDAACYVCIHSNAGGGHGTAYIAAEGDYTQKWIRSNYAAESNRLGRIINDSIVSRTTMPRHGSGSIGGEGYLILFNKCPVPAAYMEIGFFDSSDLGILDWEYEEIGYAIAQGVNEYFVQ